jgi:hypothetical protein
MHFATASFPGTEHLGHIFEAIQAMPAKPTNSGCDDPFGQRQEELRPRTADE